MDYPHKIKDSDRDQARTLWEQIFEEDSPEWLDMYFEQRAGNVILGIYDGALISMLHLNPFKLNYGNGNTSIDASYIVGVSTLPEHRHKGHMRTLLAEAIQTEANDGRPLIFLMPASEDIYTPFGFRTVYEQSNMTVSAGAKSPDIFESKGSYRTETATKAHSTLLAALSTKILSSSTDVFAVRDAAYFDFLITEMGIENGEVRIIYTDGDPVGYLCLWPASDSSPLVIRELVSDDAFDTAKAFDLVPAEHCPKIMMRVLDLPAFLKPLNSDTPLCIVLDYKDDILEEYSGRWLVQIGTEGTSAEKLADEPQSTAAVSSEAIELSLSCEDLVLWMFGKLDLSEEKALPELRNIKRPTRILLNEWI